MSDSQCGTVSALVVIKSTPEWICSGIGPGNTALNFHFNAEHGPWWLSGFTTAPSMQQLGFFNVWATSAGLGTCKNAFHERYWWGFIFAVIMTWGLERLKAEIVDFEKIANYSLIYFPAGFLKQGSHQYTSYAVWNRRRPELSDSFVPECSADGSGPFIFFLSVYKIEGGEKWVRTGWHPRLWLSLCNVFH